MEVCPCLEPNPGIPNSSSFGQIPDSETPTLCSGGLFSPCPTPLSAHVGVLDVVFLIFVILTS